MRFVDLSPMNRRPSSRAVGVRPVPGAGAGRGTRRRQAGFAILRSLAIAGALALPAAHAADEVATPPTDVSTAERRLFVDNHFRGLAGAAAIDYVFERRGSLSPTIDDTATVVVGRADTGGLRSVQIEYLHGPNQVQLPSPERVEGNPVILFFLEREVREMKRLTGGSELYFRKRMRMAFANAAELRPVRRSVEGREVDAIEIHIAPFRDDPMRARYERYADKTYLLTLSDQVPGRVIELSTELRRPAPSGGGELLLSERLRFKAAR